MTRRTDRVGEQIRGELATLLRDEVGDPRIQLVSLTQVDLSPDFRNAKIYWSSPEADSQEVRAKISNGLDSAAGFLRTRLASLLVIRRVPQLEFRHDPSLALATRTLELIRKVDEDG